MAQGLVRRIDAEQAPEKVASLVFVLARAIEGSRVNVSSSISHLKSNNSNGNATPRVSPVCCLHPEVWKDVQRSASKCWCKVRAMERNLHGGRMLPSQVVQQSEAPVHLTFL